MDKAVNIKIKPTCYIFLALAFLVLPVWWVFAWMIASIFHELCHYIALKLTGCPIYGVEIGNRGVIIETEIAGNKKALFCAMAGPLGGLILTLFAPRFPRMAICAFLQSVYNLIPIYPMDGGRALRCVLNKFCSKRIDKIEKWLTIVVLSLLSALSIYGFITLKLGILPILFIIILIYKHKRGKCTCKDKALGVK